MSAWHHRIITTLDLQSLVYHLVRGYHELRLRLASITKKEPPVLVYQMGKVGSCSLVATLKKLVPESNVYHIHRLTEEGLDGVKTRSLSKGRAFPGSDYWQAQYVKTRIMQQSGDNWRVITLTRDPVARNLSAFFHTLPLWMPNAIKRFVAGERQSLFEQLLQVFLRDYPHQKPHIWFQCELRAIFGIDIYKLEFDKSSGYSIYNHGNVSLLVMRLEDLDQCYRPALAAFFNKDTSCLDLVRVNEAVQKEYSLCYRAFLDWLVLPKEYLQDQYGTQYAHHFYNEKERMQFSKKWMKRDYEH